MGLLLIYCVGDRPLSLWGTAFVDFDCEYAAELICGGPLTVFFDCWSSAGEPAAECFMGDRCAVVLLFVTELRGVPRARPNRYPAYRRVGQRSVPPTQTNRQHRMVFLLFLLTRTSSDVKWFTL